MTDNELLLAISSIIEPVREDIQGVRAELSEVKADVSVLKTELSEVKADVSVLKTELSEVKADVSTLKTELNQVEADLRKVEKGLQEVKARVKKIELTQENMVLPRLGTIESCYLSTFDRYKDSVETYESIKQDVSIIKKVLTEHSDKLQKIS